MKRRFSLEDDFMDYKTNDMLYGFMRCLSTAVEVNGDWKEYLLKKDFTKQKKDLAKFFGCSERNINLMLRKLIDRNLIQEETLKIGKKE